MVNYSSFWSTRIRSSSPRHSRFDRGKHVVEAACDPNHGSSTPDPLPDPLSHHGWPIGALIYAEIARNTAARALRSELPTWLAETHHCGRVVRQRRRPVRGGDDVVGEIDQSAPGGLRQGINWLLAAWHLVAR